MDPEQLPFRLDPRHLGYLDLRYVLTDLIDGPDRRTWTVRELVRVSQDAGFDLGDRPSKLVSDRLRTEVARGRVVRVGWGAYRSGRIPGSTRRRIRKRARARRQEVERELLRLTIRT